MAAWSAYLYVAVRYAWRGRTRYLNDREGLNGGRIRRDLPLEQQYLGLVAAASDSELETQCSGLVRLVPVYGFFDELEELYALMTSQLTFCFGHGELVGRACKRTLSSLPGAGWTMAWITTSLDILIGRCWLLFKEATELRVFARLVVSS